MGALTLLGQKYLPPAIVQFLLVRSSVERVGWGFVAIGVDLMVTLSPARRGGALGLGLAAAKIIMGLQQSGYVESETDPSDARRKRLHVTEHGFDMLRESEAVFDRLRAEWAKKIGAARLRDMESNLAALTGSEPLRFDTPGWIARDVGVS